MQLVSTGSWVLELLDAGWAGLLLLQLSSCQFQADANRLAQHSIRSIETKLTLWLTKPTSPRNPNLNRLQGRACGSAASHIRVVCKQCAEPSVNEPMWVKQLRSLKSRYCIEPDVGYVTVAA